MDDDSESSARTQSLGDEERLQSGLHERRVAARMRDNVEDVADDGPLFEEW